MALICSTRPGWATWPAAPGSGGQDRTGTTESRGMLSAITPPWCGAMCKMIIVSERWPVMPAPNFLLGPDLLSEPISRTFMALVSFGGAAPSPVSGTRLMLSQTDRNVR